MPHPRLRAWLSLAGLAIACSAGILLSSCSAKTPPHDPTSAAGALPHKPLFVLQESPDDPLGAFTLLLKWRDGYVLGDATRLQVRLYSTAGTRIAAIGRPGSGPGEFKTIESLALSSDTTLLVFDNGLQRLSTWDLVARRPLGAGVPVSAPYGANGLVPRQDGVLLLRYLPSEKSSFEFVEIPTGRRRSAGGGAPPAIYQRSGRLASAFSGVMAGFLQDSLVLGWYLGHSLRLFGPDLTPGRWINVPRRVRRGVPPDLGTRGDQNDTPAILRRTSILNRIGALGDSQLGVVHFDATREVNSQGRTFGGTREGWLTVLDRDGTPRCVDLLLVPKTEDIVRAHFLGGRLLMSRTRAEDGVTSVVEVAIPERCLGSQR